jgi:hypothetical protein
MRALSITQPWAECILSHGKNVENRTWTTNLRGYVAIHASSSFKPERFESCFENYGVLVDGDELDYGAIVGFAKLVDVVTEEDLTQETEGWFEGDYGFVFEDVIKLKEPIEMKGTLSFWKLQGKALEKCLDQLTQSQSKRIISDQA